jgi:hypothetical protein
MATPKVERLVLDYWFGEGLKGGGTLKETHHPGVLSWGCGNTHSMKI